MSHFAFPPLSVAGSNVEVRAYGSNDATIIFRMMKKIEPVCNESNQKQASRCLQDVSKKREKDYYDNNSRSGAFSNPSPIIASSARLLLALAPHKGVKLDACTPGQKSSVDGEICACRILIESRR